jgi:hypothetical protein
MSVLLGLRKKAKNDYLINGAVLSCYLLISNLMMIYTTNMSASAIMKV